MADPTFPNLTVLSHPLIQHKLTLLRDRRTGSREFKQLVNETATLMAYEVTRDLGTTEIEIDTPLEHTTGREISGRGVTLVPILRAGLGMVDGVSLLLPTAQIGHLGLYRDHASLEPVSYYSKLPEVSPEREYLILDPMLATGGSALAAATTLKIAGAKRIRFVTRCWPPGARRSRPPPRSRSPAPSGSASSASSPPPRVCAGCWTGIRTSGSSPPPLTVNSTSLATSSRDSGTQATGCLERSKDGNCNGVSGEREQRAGMVP
jgi:uracil phosphoribosyltransferase